jgi:hypothetical protein
MLLDVLQRRRVLPTLRTPRRGVLRRTRLLFGLVRRWRLRRAVRASAWHVLGRQRLLLAPLRDGHVQGDVTGNRCDGWRHTRSRD